MRCHHRHAHGTPLSSPDKPPRRADKNGASIASPSQPDNRHEKSERATQSTHLAIKRPSRPAQRFAKRHGPTPRTDSPPRHPPNRPHQRYDMPTHRPYGTKARKRNKRPLAPDELTKTARPTNRPPDTDETEKRNDRRGERRREERNEAKNETRNGPKNGMKNETRSGTKTIHNTDTKKPQEKHTPPSFHKMKK